MVVRSSNPEGRSLQEAVTVAGTRVEDMLLAEIAELERQPGYPRRYGRSGDRGNARALGVPLSQLRGVILAPGLGAQGAGPADIAARFAGCRPGTVLPSSSRWLLRSGPDPASLRRAARALGDELAALMG